MLRALVCTCMFAFLFLPSCREQPAQNNSLFSKEAFAFSKEGVLHLFKSDSTKIHTINIEIADTDYERDTGLKNRNALTREQGILFIYPEFDLRGYYMKDIQFSLDIVFLDGTNKIVSFAENTTPLDETTFLPSQVPAQSVLMISGGLSEEWVLEVGDYVEIVRME